MNAPVPSWLIREYSPHAPAAVKRVELRPAATLDRRAGITVLVDGEPVRVILGDEQFGSRVTAQTHAVAIAHFAARQFSIAYGSGFQFVVPLASNAQPRT